MPASPTSASRCADRFVSLSPTKSMPVEGTASASTLEHRSDADSAISDLLGADGAERPVLAFAHANGFTGGSYRSLLLPLSEEFTVLPIDKLAHDPDYPVGHNLLTLRDEWLAALEQALGPVSTDGATRKVIGVGHSLGGIVNYLAVLKQPERFHCAVLLDPPLMLGRDAWGMKLAKRFGFMDRVTPAGRTRGRRARWESRQAMHDYLRRRSLFANFTDEALGDYLDHATHPQDDGGLSLSFDPDHEVAIFRNLSDHLTGSPSRLQVPLSILAGDRSELLTPPRVARLKRAGLRVEMVPGGHMYPFEQPAVTREALRDTIERLVPEVMPCR